MNDINSIWIAEIVDDRAFCSDGPLETVKYFREKITALKWLANWIGKEIEDDEDEDKRRRFLSLIEGEDFDRLFKDYQDDFDDGMLKLLVYQRTVN